MKYRLFATSLLATLLFCPKGWAQAPEDFTQLELRGNEREAALLSEYLWYHFDHRLGNSPVMFNKEYLTVADLWLNGAVDKAARQPIQAVHREHLLFAQPMEDGYIPTYQHFSHSHDFGWPFPLWTQSDSGLAGVRGKTAGWHFQPLEQVQGWVKGYLAGWNEPGFYGEGAAAAWQAEEMQSLGIVDNAWRLEVTGSAPAVVSPEGVAIEAFQAPFLQIRWRAVAPVAEGEPLWFWWERGEDAGFSEERRVPFQAQQTPLSQGLNHSILPLHEHPLWRGKIKRIKFSFAPSGKGYDLDSIFTAYDTRHTINNPIYILSCGTYFNWTGDLEFLRVAMPRMRAALRYQDEVMGGRELGHIRNTWPGHDGRAGWVRTSDGIEVRGGHGIGSNYWDLLPFGWDDFYATYQYHASLLAMAELERAMAAHPEWGVVMGGAQQADALLAQAARVKAVANEKFWSEENSRFVGWIDADGISHDYGFTFVNLDAIWYGIASEEHARAILDWLGGRRIVEGDTSQGVDIYHWRFGPRATTLRNTEWYGQGWTAPESILWGGQVQDGGAVLGFTFYDLWARLQVLGPDNAWNRMKEILGWEAEVRAAGGYRAYYADGRHGTTLQGGGSAGGLGIDFEFFESSLLPGIVPLGFLGLQPLPNVLKIAPNLPAACPEMGIKNLLYRGTRMHLSASSTGVTVELPDAPKQPIRLQFATPHSRQDTGERSDTFTLTNAGAYAFRSTP